jgi:hypothetical protein
MGEIGEGVGTFTMNEACPELEISTALKEIPMRGSLVQQF